MASSGSGYHRRWDSSHRQNRGYSSQEGCHDTHGRTTPQEGMDMPFDHENFRFEYSTMKSQGRTSRQREKVKDHDLNQMEECSDVRLMTRWFQDENGVRLRRPRIIHKIMHHSLNHQDTTEKLKDITSWILRHSRDIFDSFTCWQAELVRFLLGFVTQKEEEWFSSQADKYAQEMHHNRSSL